MDSLYREAKAHFQKTYQNVFPPSEKHFEDHFRATIDLAGSEVLLQLVSQNLEPGKNPKILDIGCGFGTFVLFCRKQGYEAYGIDNAEFEINFAQRRMREELPAQHPDEVYRLGSAESLPFDRESFAVVTLWNVLEHVPDYKKVLAEAHRVLRPGGLFFVLSANYGALRREAHYQLLWLPLMPKSWARKYLEIQGRDPSFLMNHIFYVTNLGVLTWLRQKKYRLIAPELVVVAKPELCQSSVKATILKFAKQWQISFLFKTAIRLNLFNPFRHAIIVCAQKRKLA